MADKAAKHTIHVFEIRRIIKGQFAEPEYNEQDIKELRDFLKDKGMSDYYIQIMKNEARYMIGDYKLEIDRVREKETRFTLRVIVRNE